MIDPYDDLYGEPYDDWVETALIDHAPIAKPFGVFAGVDSWRVCECDIFDGQYTVKLCEFKQLADAYECARVLNMADALREQ